MRALILCFLLVGCSGNWQRMDCSDTRTVTTITWQVTDDAYATCKAMGVETLAKGGACVGVAGDKATIYAASPGQLDDTILGHEVKHAFGCRHL